MKKTISIFLVLFIILTGCKNRDVSKPYFDFDDLEHYSLSLDSETERRLFSTGSLNSNDSALSRVLFQDIPSILADSLILEDLDKIGFTRKSVKRSKFDTIKSIFCWAKYKDEPLYKCEPVYRDILIFKQKGRTVGTAKVCFDCGHHIIAGTKYNTNSFGQSGDYEKLQNLLYENYSNRN